MIKKLLAATFTRADAAERCFNVTLSTASPDRERDRVGLKWIVRAHTPLLWSHDPTELPLGKVTNIGVRDAKLQGRILFPPEGVYGKADTVFGLIEANIIASVSVGFIPMERPTRNDLGGVDFTEQELVELSIVNCPANTEAHIDRQAMRKWLRADDNDGDVRELAVDDECLPPVKDQCPIGYELRDDGLCHRAASKDIVLDLDDISPSLEVWASAQRATRRRSEPFGDPAMHHHDIVADISKDDLRAILRGVVRDIVAATVKAEIAKAFSLARGRVD